MVSKAQAKYVRMSPRKIRLVIDLIKNKSVEEAVFILNSLNHRASESLSKVINSAFSNANQNRQEKYLAKDLHISRIGVDGGPMLRRYRAMTMGRAGIIRHRTAHIYVELDVATEKATAKNA